MPESSYIGSCWELPAKKFLDWLEPSRLQYMFKQSKELSFPAIHQDKLYIGEQIICLKTLDFHPRVTLAILPICHVKPLTFLSLAYAVRKQ